MKKTTSKNTLRDPRRGKTAVQKKGAAKVATKSAAKRPAEPPRAFRDALVGLPMPQVIRTDDPPYRVLDEGFLPLWGGDEWLFDFDPKASKGFDRDRWFVVGTNGQSDLWFYDKDTGRIVIFDHELGYDDAHCEPFSDDWETFVKAIVPTTVGKRATAPKKQKKAATKAKAPAKAKAKPKAKAKAPAKTKAPAKAKAKAKPKAKTKAPAKAKAKPKARAKR